VKLIWSYVAAERYLLGTIGEVVSPRTSYKLDRIRALLHELGDPHRTYATIHIGGTSGKGSTATMVAAALQAAGKRTGLHTKPHLHSMTERARVNGEAIAPERFAALLDDLMPAIERTTARFGRPTYYETLLALALTHFAQERVDIAVVEVGLGGRLDGTNVLEPVVAAITSIGYDHTDVLGSTLQAIALEKAGIAKSGVPLVLADVPAEARPVIEQYAAQVGAPVVHVSDVVRIERKGGNEREQRVVVTTPRDSCEMHLIMPGAFVRIDAATAIAILEQLGEAFRPSLAEIARAFEQLNIPGRMEYCSVTPAVLFDIAHNAEKAEALVASLREAFPGRRVHYVVAVGESKDARRILEILRQVPSTFTFTSFSAAGRRAMRPQRLATVAESIGAWGRAIENATEAFSVARRMAAIDDIVVVTGSTFVVGELRAWYLQTAVR
jgi:dihydrofolate synthase / folylpolyglutamate synthase